MERVACAPSMRQELVFRVAECRRCLPRQGARFPGCGMRFLPGGQRLADRFGPVRVAAQPANLLPASQAKAELEDGEPIAARLGRDKALSRQRRELVGV